MIRKNIPTQPDIKPDAAMDTSCDTGLLSNGKANDKTALASSVSSRRGFLKKAAITGAVVFTIGAGAKGVVSSLSIGSGQSYNDELRRGDSTLKSRGYEAVSKSETKELVRFFKDNYKSPPKGA